MVRETKLKPAAHLTCVNATAARWTRWSATYWDAGIRHIVALRGDPAGASAAPIRPIRAATATWDLVAGIKRIGDFQV